MNWYLIPLPYPLDKKEGAGGGVEGGENWDLNWSKTTTTAIETYAKKIACGGMTEIL